MSTQEFQNCALCVHENQPYNVGKIAFGFLADFANKSLDSPLVKIWSQLLAHCQDVYFYPGYLTPLNSQNGNFA